MTFFGGLRRIIPVHVIHYVRLAIGSPVGWVQGVVNRGAFAGRSAEMKTYLHVLSLVMLLLSGEHTLRGMYSAPHKRILSTFFLSRFLNGVNKKVFPGENGGWERMRQMRYMTGGID